MGQSYLSSDEAHSLGRCGLRSGTVEVQSCSSSPSDELVNGFVTNLSLEIPECQVDHRDDSNRKTLPAIEHRCTVHLLEQVVDIARVCSEIKQSA